jgi:hypothetical protein
MRTPEITVDGKNTFRLRRSRILAVDNSISALIRSSRANTVCKKLRDDPSRDTKSIKDCKLIFRYFWSNALEVGENFYVEVRDKQGVKYAKVRNVKNVQFRLPRITHKKDEIPARV